MAFPTTPVLDTFVRANENPLDNGTWESFPHWFANNLTQILSNSAQATGTDNGAVWKTTFGQDQEAYVTITEVNGLAWFAINIRGTVFNNSGFLNDSYDVGIDVGGQPGKILCENQSPDWGTWGANVTQSVSNGDSLGIRAIGSALEAWYKPSGGSWTQIRTGTNSTHIQSGKISLAFGYSGTSPKFNDFGGGTYVAPTTPRNVNPKQAIMRASRW